MKSYLVDTNYFLRLFIKDNSEQYRVVYTFFQRAIKAEIEIFTTVIVFFEVYWVISKFYQYNKEQTIVMLKKILQMDFLQIENRDILTGTIELFELSNLDLEDCYNIIYYQVNSYSQFATFDKQVLKELK